MLVNSKEASDHRRHLEETFKILKQYNMKLNPQKCTFGVKSGEFLGYLVTQRGIEASPEQVRAIVSLKSPRCIKDVQRLTGKVAALNRFISKSADRCRLFYEVLRKNKCFQWTHKYEEAF